MNKLRYLTILAILVIVLPFQMNCWVINARPFSIRVTYFDEVWNPELSNSTSDIFRAKAAYFITNITNLLNTTREFSLTVVSMEEGSIVVNFLINTYGYASADQVVKELRSIGLNAEIILSTMEQLKSSSSHRPIGKSPSIQLIPSTTSQGLIQTKASRKTTEKTVNEVIDSTNATSSNSTKSPPIYTSTEVTITFPGETWIAEYGDQNSFKFKIKAKEIENKIMKALKELNPKSVTVLSMTEGSLIVDTEIRYRNSISIEQLIQELKKNGLDAKLTYRFPNYAIILISVLSTVVVMSIAFILAMIVFNKRKVRRYNTQTLEYFDLEQRQYARNVKKA